MVFMPYLKNTKFRHIYVACLVPVNSSMNNFDDRADISQSANIPRYNLHICLVGLRPPPRWTEGPAVDASLGESGFALLNDVIKISAEISDGICRLPFE